MREIARRLEESFRRIAVTRMAGLPFVNPQLRVEVVGLTEWDGRGIAVLVTPWAINVIVIPGEGKWQSLPQGAECFLDLPAGRMRFIAARDDAAGEYLSCSLFSFTLGFADHRAARTVAFEAREALFQSDGGMPRPAVSRRDFLRGNLRAGHAD